MSRTIQELLAEVQKRWSEERVQTEPPATFANLRAFESTFNVHCPTDFATYLTTLGGMKGGEWDQHLIRFWSLKEIRPVEDMPAYAAYAGYAGYCVFADHSISAYEFAVQCGRPNRSDVVRVAPTPRPIAATFSEFVARYLDDVDALFR